MQSLIKEKLIRDPVHDQIVFDVNSREDQILLALIDTPEFQRLRRIRQLGMAFFAYQGADHCRFSHSIGVLWIATRILARFERVYGIDPVHSFPARCAALLHDLGHGPFSHVIEALFQLNHEEWTRRILCSSESRVNHVLCSYDLALPSAVAAVFNHEYDPPYLGDLISSQLDADRLDYLTRDGLMTGVKHGVFDLERLLYCLRLDAGGRRLLVSGKDVLTVEKYLQSRYHMFKQVYQHSTVVTAEAMLLAQLRRAMRLTAEGRAVAAPADSPLGRFLAQDGQIDLADFLSLDDAALLYHWTLWRDDRDPILSDLSQRLLERNMFKHIPIDSSAPGFGDRLEACRSLLRRHGYDPEYYLLRLEAGSVPYRPFEEGQTMKVSPILVEGVDGSLEDLRNVSRIAAALAREGYRQSHLAFPGEKGTKDLKSEIQAIFT